MKIVIIGAGPTGVTVAETLRKHSKDAEIIMLSRESFPPYSPPAMLEYFMTGEEAHLWKWKDVPEALGVDYRPGAEVLKVVPDRNQIILKGSATLGYDHLVIASGSSLYAPVPGSDKHGIYNFKSLSAAEKLINNVRRGSVNSAIIVGAGFIGVEIAVLLKNLGIDVRLFEKSNILMPEMLNDEVAQMLLSILQKRKIDVHVNTKVSAYLGGSYVKGIELESGETIRADIFISATGVKPNIDFLDGSGIYTNWGIPVDSYLRTNFPNVYAGGDVAETMDRISRERNVHAIYPNAIDQGYIIACNILGWNVSYEGADRMNSLKHLGIPVVIAGYKKGEALRIRYGDNLRVVYLFEGFIVGFQLAGDIRASGIYRTLMNKKVKVDHIKSRLLEPGFSIGHIPFMSRNLL